MDTMLIFKALSNETRVQILEWLKKPDANFGPQLYLPLNSDFKGGICVGSIQEKTGLAQSVVSNYLLLLKKAGLLESRRYGQWTYYRRNEETFLQLADFIKNEM
ncbi:ArsR/SmtB family transcription factor [Paenibacillus guangzhouensis]|uniref:ArsR/SmtB family transcription factor n=1 Tax=Paenibacillus guangzhouensis TaxID=1473112 RepID=UPI001266D408|nr:helix-turn-helix transcriptional regulator [Paenibacillus guangzhouensis]